MKPAIHIVGGTGRMGTWLSTFLQENGYKISISGRDLKAENLQSADIVFISVPISHSQEVIGNVSKVARKSTLVIDLSSVMSPAASAFKKIPQKGIHMHFLFGPDAVTLASQTIILSAHIPQPGAHIESLFKKYGAHILLMSTAKHDKQMATIQNLTHFTNIVFLETIQKQQVQNLTTPTFLAQLSAVQKVLGQDLNLIAEIQNNNPYGKSVIHEFIKNAADLSNLIGKPVLVSKLSNIQKGMTASREKVAGHKDSSFSAIQKNKKAAYLGPEFTNTYAAAQKTGLHALIPKNTIPDIFLEVESGKALYGVVPAQNTIEGAVRETFDLLSSKNVKVIGSVYIPINHVLASCEKHMSNITTVYSHPQALAQCKNFLEKYPNIKAVESQSTVSNIEIRKNDKGSAFITTPAAAHAHKFQILRENIQDYKDNTTRFFIISKSAKRLEQATKTLLFLSVYNRVGVLKDILTIFANENINLSNIESRPSLEKSWDYNFFIEVDEAQESESLKEALIILKQYCTNIKILGGVS